MLFSITSMTTYASFPVTDPIIDPPIIEVVESAAPGDFNWQAIVSAACLSSGWLSIPGLVFGIMAVKGDKNMKWLGWIGLIGNAVIAVVMIALLSSM